MALKTEERDINGHKYSVTQFVATEGLRIKIALGKYIGPSLPHFVKGGTNTNVLDAELDRKGALVAIEKLIEHLDEVDTVNLILRMLKSGGVRRDGVEVGNETIFNTEFAGNYIELYKALGFIVEVNYGKDFFGEGGIGKLLEKLMEEEKKKNTVPPLEK